MQENLKRNFDMNKDDKILAGVDLVVQYLGSGELSKSGGTDREIAYVLHDIHSLYAQRKSSMKKAREVVVFVDTQRINVYTKDDETLFSFPLTQVKDVTTCLNQAPYSKTCVLVAREDKEALYKAYVFYCNTEQKAVEFYQVVSLAFQVGFKMLEKLIPFTELASDETELGSDEAMDNWKCSMEEITDQCEQVNEINQNQIKPPNEANDFETIERLSSDKSHKDSTMERTVTVRLPKKNTGSANWKIEEGIMKIDLGFEETSNPNQSKLSVYIDSVGETSRFLLSRWFRSSYRKFRKSSGKSSTGQKQETL